MLRLLLVVLLCTPHCLCGVHDVITSQRPLHFIENKGQWDNRFLFGIASENMAVGFEKDGITIFEFDIEKIIYGEVYHSNGVTAKRYSFLDINPNATVVGEGIEVAKYSFYVGNDKSRWVQHAASYRNVVYKNIWPNIDVIFAITDNKLVSTIVLKPDAKESDIQIIVGRTGGFEHKVREYGSTIETNSLTSPRRRYFRTEYGTFICGASHESVSDYSLNSKKELIIVGVVYTNDYPLVNPLSFQAGGEDCIISIFDCDGKTLLFSTRFGGTSSDRIHSMEIATNDDIVFGGYTRSDDFPITDNALEKHRLDTLGKGGYLMGFLSILKRNGTLSTSTYLNMRNKPYGDGGNLGVRVSDIKISGVGNIHALIYSHGFIPYPSTNALFSKNNSRSGSSLLVLNPNGDSVLYASDIPGELSPRSLLLNGDSTVVMAFHSFGPGSDGKRDTLVNPIWDGGRYSKHVYLMKLDYMNRKIIYSTYFGGSYRDYPLVLLDDSLGNTYLIGGTNSNDLPIVNGFQKVAGQSSNGGINQDNDVFIAKISPIGILFASTYLGGNYSDLPTGAVITNRGDLLLTIDVNSDNMIIQRDGLPDVGNKGMYLAVMDTSLSKLRYLFPITHGDGFVVDDNYGSNGDGDPKGDIIYHPSGYLYVKSNVYKTKWEVPTFNAYRSNSCGADDDYDIALHRFYLPLAGQDYLSCSIQSPDNIRITKNPNFILPSVFDLSVIVTNNDSSLPGIGGSVELTLPPGLLLHPSNQPLAKALERKTLMPGQSDTVTWRVRYDEAFTGDSLPVNAAVYYDIPNVTEACLKAANMCDKDIFVLRDQVFTPEVLCSMNAPSSLTAAQTRFTYVEKPFEVRASLRNSLQRDVHIKEIHLVYGKGMAVHHAPGSDSILAVGVLKPSESRDFVWRIIARERPSARDVQFMVIAYDSLGNVVTSCETSVTVPPIVALPCDVIAPVSVRYFPSTNTFIPDPVRITGYLQNTLDTTQNIVKACVSLARASHLELLAGESEDQAPFTNSPNFRRTLYWALKAKPVSSGEIDTVVVQYRTELGNTEDSCEAIVRFVIINAELSCSLSGPDSLRVSGSSYTPHPFVFSYMLQNIGQTPVRNLKTRLSLSSDAITSADQLERTLSELSPSQSHQYNWILQANTSKYNRTVTLTVITEDSLGNELTRCEKTIFLPRISPALLCTLEAPDTIRYDLLSDTYSPNPFTASLTLQNILDTAEVNIETEIDLAAAPHVALVTGETARKTIDVIEFRNQKSVIWNLTIAQRTNAPVSERITIRYRAENDSAWQSCEKVIVIEGKERTLRASCGAYGPDSLFGDPAYEKFIPEPAQLVYAITNTGTLPLTGCTATIIVPQDFRLVAGDATQSYGVIMPGQTVWREWSLVPVQNAQLTTYTVRWQWSCDSIQTNDCAHDITLKAGAPIGYVLSPWKLRFEAEQGASLPAERTVSLWPGGGASLLWQSTNGTTWLDWSPKSEVGSQRSDIRVQPNTTAMPVGIYSDAIAITAADPVRPPQIEVEYEIWKMLSTKITPSPSGIELQSWPNPTSGVTDYALRVSIAGYYKLVIHDMYGRELGVIYAGQLSPGTHALRYNAAHLPAGVYLTTFLSAHARATKMMVVRR